MMIHIRTSEITNSEKYIDSRDVIKRINDLQGTLDGLESDVDDAREAVEDATTNLAEAQEACLVTEGVTEIEADALTLNLEQAEKALEDATEALDDAQKDLDEFKDDDEYEELKALMALAEEGEDSPNWNYGETLIRGDEFVDYVQELLADIGDLPKDIPGYIVIDWDATADNIRMDYFTVDFDGVEYLIRS